MSTLHTHNISTNLFYLGSICWAAPEQSYCQISPDMKHKVGFLNFIEVTLALMDSRQAIPLGSFNDKDYVIPETWQTEQPVVHIFSLVILEPNTQLSLQFSINVLHFYQIQQNFCRLSSQCFHLAPGSRSNWKYYLWWHHAWCPWLKYEHFLLGCQTYLTQFLLFLDEPGRVKQSKVRWVIYYYTTSSGSEGNPCRRETIFKTFNPL